MEAIELFRFEKSEHAKQQLEDAVSELVGGANQLQFVRDELQNALRHEDLVDAFEYADYELENYLVRLYSMLERAFTILSLKTGKAAGRLKKPGTRSKPAAEFLTLLPEPTKVLLQLLQLTDEDIEFRHKHTHSNYFQLRVTNGEERWPISSALQAAERVEKERPGTLAEIRSRLRFLLEALVQDYTVKIDRVIDLAHSFLTKVEGWDEQPPEIIVDGKSQ